MGLFLLRHAQKLNDFEGNPALSHTGHLQAKRLAQLVRDGQLPKPDVLLASDKIRTQETLTPLSQAFGVKIQIWNDLTEQKGGETLQQFHQRIISTLQKIEILQPQTVYACTHYDWMIESMSCIDCEDNLQGSFYVHWKPTQGVHFKKADSGLWQLEKQYRPGDEL